ncbi:MAG: rod shape-determining protein MreD [Mangrovimonas sp.]|nr:rod shape-determining protein MreD [Mangrovimonas sp.]MCB0439281.1 rod shape-determining protein MreD [Mangrovimonas sp.]HPF97617.1 rod shape-determining protein MreD [Mangrovimonas sp.]
MNSSIALHISRFVLLVLLQVLILNHINFLGYINPYAYILFILLFPISNNRQLFILLSFVLGFTIDLFSDSGGIHAAACVTIAYLRPMILKFTFGTSYEHQTLKIGTSEIGPRITYFTIIILIHHFILFTLEVFNTSNILLIAKKSLFSSIFTLIMCLILTVLFSRNSK